jgi:hypothetical protein
MGVLAKIMSTLALWRDKALTARHECWLIVGLFIVNLGSAIPFGVSDSAPNAALTLNEWISSGLLAILAFVILAGMFNNKILSWAGLAGGMIWAGVAAGTFHDNFFNGGTLSMETKVALILIPLGIGMSHLSLERYVERPRNRRATDPK